MSEAASDPPQVLEHEHARQDHRSGVDLVLAGVLGSGPVGRLEDAVAGDVVDVASGGDADPAHLGGQRVGQVVAVQVGGGDDVEVLGPGEHLLQGDVGDGVLDEQLAAGVPAAVVPPHRHVRELLPDELVAPVAEGPLGELLDVALVHQRDALAPPGQRVLDGGAHQALGAELRDGLDPDARVGPDLPSHLVAQERREAVRLGGAGLHLETGVHVLGVLPEDHHVDLLGVEHRRRDTGEPAHGAQAHVEVEDLAQGHVEGPDPAAHRRGERPLDADEVLAEGLDGLVGEPVPGLLEGLLPRQDLLPGDLPAVLGGGRVEDEARRGPDVDAGPVPLDERDDRLVGDLQDPLGGHGDALCHVQRA